MSKKYTEIDFGFVCIDKAVEQLARHKERGELVFGIFNGQNIYSDVDDLDSAYKKVTGKTKTEFDEAYRKDQQEYEDRKATHKAAIPELTKEWIEKGNAILDAQYHELWAKCVPVRLADLYEGMELGNCLDIVKVLNDGGALEDAKALILNQGHSGMSFSLVRSMVKSFCERGGDFSTFIK